MELKILVQIMTVFAVFQKAASQGECRDRLPNCQSNLGLCTQSGELVFQTHYCKATCGNCGASKENTVPSCPAEWNTVPNFLKHKFTQGQLEFAWKLYSHIPLGIRVRNGGNFVMSPNTLGQMLAVLYEGSEGSTTELLRNSDLFKAMTKNDTKHTYAKMANSFRRQMAQPLPKATELYSANLMFFGDEFKITENFLKIAAGCYDTAMMQRKDHENTAQAKQEINKGIQGFAYGLPTKQIIDPTDLRVPLEPKSLTLVSGMYFKSDLNAPRTVVAKFYPTTIKEGVDVPMHFMHQHMKEFRSDQFNCRLVGIPFIHQEQMLWIMLPNQRYGLTLLERSLTWKAIQQMMKQATFQGWVPALIPNIHAHSVIDVKEPLVRMGLQEMMDNPNLDNIFLGHKQPKPISNFYHRTDFKLLEVNPRQFDNSTQTKEQLEDLPTEQNNFMAIHPFLFLVTDERTGAILLFGRVLNPAKGFDA